VNSNSGLNEVGGKGRNANTKVKCAELRETRQNRFHVEKEKKERKEKVLCEEGYHTSRPARGTNREISEGITGDKMRGRRRKP